VKKKKKEKKYLKNKNDKSIKNINSEIKKPYIIWRLRTLV